MSDFENRFAIVFGGGRDIGGAVVVELARRGARVAFSYHGSDPTKVMDAVAATGQPVLAQKVNAIDMAQVRNFAGWAAKEAGQRFPSS